MSDRIVITARPLCRGENEVVAALRERGYEVITHPDPTPPRPDQLERYLADAVGMIAGAERIPAEVLARAPRLRVISRHGIGTDGVDLAAATELGIPVTYVPDVMADAVADMTMGLLLAVARRICEGNAAVKAGRWERELHADVTGRVLGLIGTGRIGMAVAQRARAFRMRLLGHDPAPNPLFVEELGGDYVALDELLAAADFVSLHVPLSSATHRLIDRERLARMKPTAFLINTARGGLVDPDALYAALREGRLAGAAFDVFPQEPPEPHPVWQLPNVITTPHVASFTPKTVAAIARGALGNLLAALNGERVPHCANPEVYARGVRR